ncbi:hypothetical protein G9A89_016350 [Geosiphon pyriformis]|nr:hypothetical protein G9A89_016350 [Geosiphon pyriformis]
MRINLEQALWIPEYARTKLVIQEAHHINKKGEFVLTSDRTRSQQHNFDDCITKLYDAIVKAAEVPKGPNKEKLLRIERLKKAEDQRRKEAKQFRSQNKANRRFSFDN